MMRKQKCFLTVMLFFAVSFSTAGALNVNNCTKTSDVSFALDYKDTFGRFSLIVTNSGTTNASDISIKVFVDKGLFIFIRNFNYGLGDITPGESREAPIPIIGFGRGILKEMPIISVTIYCNGEPVIEESFTAKIFYSFIKIQ